MAILYNTHNVDERYSAILEPNLYYGNIFQPGVTFTDKYQVGPAGQIYVHKLTTSAVEPGTPGRDFTDIVASDSLIPIQMNNNYQQSRKIYGVAASAVAFPMANEHMAGAIADCREGWQQSAMACLVQESTAAALTTAITDPKTDIIATRKEIVKKKGRANVVICSPDFYGLVLESAGKDFTPSVNDRIVGAGNVGTWLGFTFIEAAGLSAANAKYYDSTGALKTVAFANIDYIMYYSEALSIVTNFETTRLVDSENFVGSKAQVEMNTGFKVTNKDLVFRRAHTTSGG